MGVANSAPRSLTGANTEVMPNWQSDGFGSAVQLDLGPMHDEAVRTSDSRSITTSISRGSGLQRSESAVAAVARGADLLSHAAALKQRAQRI